MRLNKHIALHSDYSRRAADTLISDGRVLVNGEQPRQGQDVSETDEITIDGRLLQTDLETTTIILNKPRGYVCSRDGQGSRTIYELLPHDLHRLNSVGRLDKDSSGLIVLTNDGELANQLTHPRYEKVKVYEVNLSTALLPLHQQMISDIGVTLTDGVSKLQIQKLDNEGTRLKITMREGRNRQIRRTFAALGYNINKLHRISFGTYHLNDLPEGQIKKV